MRDFASLLGACPESLLLDNDIPGSSLQTTEGTNVTSGTLGFGVIALVCLNGKCRYHSSDQTFEVMQSEYIHPQIFNRYSPSAWDEVGESDSSLQVAGAKERILGSPLPTDIDDTIDRRRT